MPHSPMLSSPLKQTNEIDWVQPLKNYIRQTYGDDPERYSEECNTLNRLRQDMRGAGRDSTAGRDLLYRYYGQLELLDLRFPVDENHIKISFTWFDAFTHQPTSQYSLAYEKASIIFNISAALSCHAGAQDRNEEAGQKSAYHSYQASAGMFTYINDNFLHAPSKDLSRETIKTLITMMLAQAQEVFVEKQIADGRKAGLLAKLASQAASLYTQCVDGIQENLAKGVFDRLWLLITQVKANHMSSIAQYHQATADDEANLHGTAVSRLQLAERDSKEACRIANSFPASASGATNITTDMKPSLLDTTTRHMSNVQEKLAVLNKDNDFIYHQTIPGEASLAVITKLAAAKAIPVSELYQAQDIQRIIGPDIFQKIVPMAITESASLYDEEKAKLVRAEAERVDTADGEMAASLDYLKLPGSLTILKGGMDQNISIDDDFRNWCQELAGHESFSQDFERLQSDRANTLATLTQCYRWLDQEEITCEKMRSKYGADWTQQPSSKLTATLRGDISRFKSAIQEAGTSDSRLLHVMHQHESEFDELRSAGETQEADILYQQAIIKCSSSRSRGSDRQGSPGGRGEETLLDEDWGDDEVSVAEQIFKVEDIMRKLELVKKDRVQVLKDLKEKAHNDDISNVLILNKKTISNVEQQLFQVELDKFRPHQNRLLQANHKQTALLKELTRSYGALLQDKRVKSEQAKYERFSRQRSAVLTKYKRAFQAFHDLLDGLARAKSFYSDMNDTVESLQKNVETFVNNRRSEGAQLLDHIERDKQNNAENSAGRERDRLHGIMERFDSDLSISSPPLPAGNPNVSSQFDGNTHQTKIRSPQNPNAFSNQARSPDHLLRTYTPNHNGNFDQSYNPMNYSSQSSSPPISQQPHLHNLPQGYVPPPPPPGPPPSSSAYQVSMPYQTPNSTSSGSVPQSNDPWAGLNAWK